MNFFSKARRVILNAYKLLGAYGKAIKDGYKSNAFSPYAWFAVFPVIVLLIVVLLIDDRFLRLILIGIVAFIILFASVMYVLLFKKDPKLLQSEWYRLEDKRLGLIADKGGDFKIKDLDLTPIAEIGGETHE